MRIRLRDYKTKKILGRETVPNIFTINDRIREGKTIKAVDYYESHGYLTADVFVK
ncbi:MAG: hypothetical protein OES34_11730 [Nitrosopumilus sp.]|nr:hypothetical protein [Nitrosopumilus sp.]